MLENRTNIRLRETCIIPCARKPLKAGDYGVGDYGRDYETTEALHATAHKADNNSA